MVVTTPPHIWIIQTNLVTRIRLWNREPSSMGIILGDPWGFLARDVLLHPTRARAARLGGEFEGTLGPGGSRFDKFYF